MSMFFGVISLRSSSFNCSLRQRLRSAMATARLASLLSDDVLVELLATISFGIHVQTCGLLIP